MQDTTLNQVALRGGEFLLRPSQPADVFIPEEISEEQRMIRETVREFVHTEILPNWERIDKQEEGFVPGLIKKLAELGIVGAHMPEAYGGIALDNNTNTFITEEMGASGSFSVSFSAHTGIGMLPILYYGTEAQKQKYLPGLISGELKAAYCLTEPGSGSDALAAKTRADLTSDGQFYVLNGQKMWITNSGFADLFIVFAKIGGEKFTGFIVERNSEGLTFGAEENKLGIKGSSTRQVFFENVHVPAENLLGEIGKGHLIAFNILNVGRFKLGVGVMGGAKKVASLSVQYANERVQFGEPISHFGAIQHKLAEQAIRTFAVESAIYRVSNLLEIKAQEAMHAGASYAEARQLAAEEYAIECAILKVAGSEALDYVVDEMVQIYGGMGYSEEAPAARAYRDARINRIFEGTNEINRMLTVDMLFKRAMKGAIDLVGPAWAVQKELASMPSMEAVTGAYGEEKKALEDFKKIVLMTAGAAAKMQMDGKLNLKEAQEILMSVADMMIELFLAESLLLRVEKLSSMETSIDQDTYDAILQTHFHDAGFRIQKSSTDALTAFAEGDLLRTFLMGLKRFSKYPPRNVMSLRRKIASALIEANAYCF
ncbi:MAG: acyl-CoA dehydrogenase family protein [Haliscomenobacter sp.]|nr:acyl-CoA dehydrogenase family protein [Haliscomenobacter sp.]MBP9872982.1 acyl-CoA dehydrogenase family protein [Haliscomenobacter sp.]